MKFIQSIVSLFLAFVMLVITVGVTINVHYCAGKIRSVGFYVKADACKDEQSCNDKHGDRMNGCCAEKTIIVKGKETAVSLKDFLQNSPSFKLVGVVLPVWYKLPVRHSGFHAITAYAFYKPPLLGHTSSPAFLQSFLI